MSEFIPMRGVYAAGRLDKDSEGLLILTSDGGLAKRITDPEHKLPKTYLVQVEGMATGDALSRLRAGISLKHYRALPCEARLIPEPEINPREVRNYHPTSWLEIILFEGKNCQVRRMTAAVGFPTLRLLRIAIGSVHLGDLQPGEWRTAAPSEINELKSITKFSHWLEK